MFVRWKLPWFLFFFGLLLKYILLHPWQFSAFESWWHVFHLTKQNTGLFSHRKKRKILGFFLLFFVSGLFSLIFLANFCFLLAISFCLKNASDQFVYVESSGWWSTFSERLCSCWETGATTMVAAASARIARDSPSRFPSLS